MIRLLIADDHQIVRDGIASLLTPVPDLHLVGQVANARQVLEYLEKDPVDVVLLDLQMPGMEVSDPGLPALSRTGLTPVLGGLEATQLIRQRFPTIRVLVLTMLDQDGHVAQLMEAGAMGYVLKDAGGTELLHAIRSVAGGTPFISSQITLNLSRRPSPFVNEVAAAAYPLEQLGATPERKMPGAPDVATPGTTDAEAPSTAALLTKREMEVLRLLAQGLTTEAIADRLFTSRRTVETHRQHLLEKTNSKNTPALIALAAISHWLD